jgi:hypothetical protein
MALAISAIPILHPRTGAIENGLDAPSQMVSLFRQRLSEFSFLTRGAGILFSWGQLLPLGEGLQSLSTVLRTHISALSSLFSIPRFIFNCFDLYNNGIDLQKIIADPLVNFLDTLKKVKTTFVTVIYSSISTIGIVRLLDQYALINFKELFGSLYDGLLSSQRTLLLAASGITWLESAWALGNQIRTDLGRAGDKSLSPSLVKCLVRMCGSSLRLISTGLNRVLLSIGMSFGPLVPWILVILTSLSFLSDLLLKMLNQNHLVYEGDDHLLLHDLSHLPA